ncbi:4-hydroxybenzoyl-CoA reductase subunit beta [Herminiimonas sp. CN]|uniref:4-hydroxybenzoyl-CoA reductase subunit beta n=1 Tax=Herminiimonas sp. CN TaxID=1349818 RepID=UPI00047397A7|nr:4-hydroxybenzoyl-CoA reductase subunit beta [Herminiimonas sp. CN]
MELLSQFTLLRPNSVAEAIAARAGKSGARFLAGGTDLLPNMRHGLVQPDTLIDLGGIAELRGITHDGQSLRIGAGTTLEQLANDPLLRDTPALVEAALAIAGPTHRAVGTIGGNLCLDTRCQFYNQSDAWREANNFCMKLAGDTCRVAPKSDRCYAAFSGDLAPALMVHRAVAEIAGPSGVRHSPLAEIYADDGIAYLTLAPEEMLVAVRVPLVAGLRSGYQKIRIRGAIDFPLAGVAVALRVENNQLHDLRIAATGAESRPLLINGLDALCGIPLDDALVQLDKLLRKQVAPMETSITPAAYRRRVLPVLARRVISRLIAASAE